MDRIFEYMLAEDEGFGDITSNAVVDPAKSITAFITAYDNGIFAGGEIVSKLFEANDVDVAFFLSDGAELTSYTAVMSIRGLARDIFRIERTALNLLMRMSGVATTAKHYCDLVKNYDVKVAGTRKTMPGLAKFDNYALNVGGADTHRLRLDDMVLIKENHIDMCDSVLDALTKAKENTSFSKKIEIEVETIEDAITCVENSADIVMLDNMDPANVEKVLDKLEELNIRQNSLIEVSGGINESNIVDYAKLDVDIISVGALTHSAKSIDMSLRVI